MKTFTQFLESTPVKAQDVKKVADKTASSDAMAQKLTAIQQRRQAQRAQQKKITEPARTLRGKGLPPGKKGGELATGKGSSLATREKSGKLTRGKNYKEPIGSKTYPPRPDDEKQAPDARRRALDKMKQNARQKKNQERKKEMWDKTKNILSKSTSVAKSLVSKPNSDVGMGNNLSVAGGKANLN